MRRFLVAFLPRFLYYEHMTYRFATVLTQEGKWYVARAVELGVVSQGKNISEALENLKEAVELYLEDNPKMKKSISAHAPLLTTLELQHV